MTIGFIGCGNMGGALATAIAKNKNVSVLLSDKDEKKVASLVKKTKGRGADLEEICAGADTIFLGVKPQGLNGLLGAMRPLIQERKDLLLVSMAAGRSIASIEENLGFAPAILRIMPNLAVSVGEGMILYAPNEKVTEEQKTAFLKFMTPCGALDKLPENLIDAGMALSGCAPAYAFLFAEALADGAVACGIPRAKANLYASQVLIGSGKLLEATGKHPGELKDGVCSPGGTTIAGVRELEKGAFRSAVTEAVVKAYEKTKSI